jgi:hypothetical protein
VKVRSLRLGGVRKVVGVMFSYTHRQADVSAKFVCRMHITEEFPFLVTKLLPYYEW